MDLKDLTDKFNKLFSPELKVELKKAIEETKLAEDEPTENPETTDPSGEVYNEAKLKDGTVIKYVGDLAVGTKILAVTEAGELPAPEGEHELESGEILVVVKEGEDSVIQEIKTPDPAAEETQMRAELEKQYSEKLESITKAYDEKFNALNKEYEKLALKLSKTTASVHTVALAVGELVKLPTEEPIENPENKEVKLSKKEKLIKSLK